MLIRNKFRNIPQVPAPIKKYEPEYKRIGVTPEIVNHAVVRPASFPRNVRVNSGQNEDLAWIPKEKQQPVEIIDNNDEVVIQDVRERTFVNENFQDGARRNVPIAYDEIPDVPSSVVEPINHVTAQFSEVDYGEYVLIFDNEILGAGSMQEVSEAIETILLSDKNNSISPESLVVLKRMQIMTGVLIKDV